LLALIAMRCTKTFSRPLFFSVYLLDTLIALAIIVLQAIKGHS
jgi:hypothetical protein